MQLSQSTAAEFALGKLDFRTKLCILMNINAAAVPQSVETMNVCHLVSMKKYLRQVKVKCQCLQ